MRPQGAVRWLVGALPGPSRLPDEHWERHHDVVSAVLGVLALTVPLYGAAHGFAALHVAGHAAPLVLLTIASRWKALHRGLRQVLAVIGLMTAAALVVHAAGGATEAHFAFFALLPFAAVYGSRMPFLVAVAFVAVHHFAVAVLVPGSVFPADAPPLPTASLHAAFVLVESIACLVAWRLFEDRRESVEQLVDERTSELRRQRDLVVRQAAAIEATDDAVILTSVQGVITGWNPGAERLYGYPAAEALGAHITMLITPERLPLFGSRMAALADGESLRIDAATLRKGGERIPTSVTVSNIHDDTGRVVGMVGISRDMTERHLAERQARESARQLEDQADQLTRLAFHDQLTGLGNRALFQRRLGQLVAAAARHGATPFALIVLDLDDFKVVNDSLGHATGDALLVAAAERLSGTVADGSTVARLGGDEFAVLLHSAGEGEAVSVAERILAAFYGEFHVLGHALSTTASVGIAVGGPEADAAHLLRDADLAMYAAKAAGKGKLTVYRHEMLVAAQQRLDMENHLRHALERQEISLSYQPIVRAQDGELHSVEALMRWHHPRWGAVSPGTFIPVAEASGTIVELGSWALHQACRDGRDLAEQLGRPVRMSVNVSVRQLQAPGFVTVVRSALHESGLEPALLCLEVTESLLMAEDPQTVAVLRELDVLGVHLSIDDFGTGHSSLARLRTIPFSELKIDRAFIHEITPEGHCGPIVTAVVAMARALGVSVVAEGVETKVQLEALQRLGCDAIQGFLVARPVPFSELRLDRAPVEVPRQRTPDTDLIALITKLQECAPATAEMPPRVVALVREALGGLVAATGLDSVYLTSIDLAAEQQTVLLSHSAGDELVPEGLVLEWSETLCKRACDVGPAYTTDVPSSFPGSRAAQELGLMTYISVPIRRSGGELVGTLCGASSTAHQLDADAQTLVEVFAYVIGPQLAGSAAGAPLTGPARRAPRPGPHAGPPAPRRPAPGVRS